MPPADKSSDAPMRTLELTVDPVTERLEALDDIVFPAIEGDAAALKAAEPAWHQALNELGAEVVQESRREYLRYARTTWRFLKNQSVQQPQRLLAVVQVIALLLGADS